MGEAAGVAVDTNGHVFVFHRPGRGFDPAATETLADPPVLEIDAVTGQLIHSWGANTFLVPHGITIDRRTTSSSRTWACIRCSSTRTTAS